MKGWARIEKLISKDRVSNKLSFIFTVIFVFSGTSIGIAQVSKPATDAVPAFNIVKPSTTGVPGEEVRLMRFDPAGNLWVGARWPFWGEAGVAMLSADQLPYEPLPGGGFDTGAWKVWSSVHHPIPSPYLFDMEFSEDGTMWLASEGGLTRFRQNAANAQDMWHTYTSANSPLAIDSVSSIAIDSQGNIWVVNASVQQSRGLFKLNPATNQWTQVTIQAPGGSVQSPTYVAVGNNDHILVSLWLTGGFAEFNGTSWTIRDGAPRLEGLMQDAQGNVWATTGGSGLWKWNGTSWQNWAQVGGTVTITGLGKDRDGVVYVSTWYGPVYKMIGDTPVFFADADNIPRSVIGRPNGEIWISNYGGNGTLGTVRHYTADGQLLERFNTYNSGLPDYFIDRIKRDSAGNLWFACGEGGLSRMLGSNGASTAGTHWRNWGNHNDLSEPYPWAGNEPMYSVFEDSGGIFWMGGNGVGRWDSNTGQFTGFWNWQNSSLGTDGIKDIVKRGGTIWVGTRGSGVSWFNPATNQWTRVWLHTGQYAYGPNNVKAMTVDTQNNLWVASEYGLRKFDPGSNAAFTLYDSRNSGLPNNWLYDLEADPNGGIWVATGEGLVRFDGTTWTMYNQANTGMPGTVVYDVARRPSDGLIAIANNQPNTSPYTGGVSTFDGQTWTHYTTANSPLTHWQVMAVEFDSRGDLWASAMSEGVVEILIGSDQVRKAPFDFDGDGRSDVAVFRPTGGVWYLQQSAAGFASVQFGLSGDKIAPADYDGDGKTDVAVFRDGTWYLLRSQTGFAGMSFGSPGDIPQAADFNGDGKADVAVFRPSSGVWHIYDLANNQASAVQFGLSEDKPAAADFTGDGKADVAVFRPSSGVWYVLDRTNGQSSAVQFGLSGDRPVAGDYDGDGKTDPAVYRDGTWYVLRSRDGLSITQFGTANDKPAPADYDGDGKTDPAVFRDGTWYLQQSTSGVAVMQFGLAGDVPVSSANVP